MRSYGICDQRGGGRWITGERRGRGKSSNTNRGLMGTDNERELTVAASGGSRGGQWGKRWDNCPEQQ